MAEPIRIGIVGATVTQGGSGWGANAHVPALRVLPEFTLRAVCTSRVETAQASAERFGAELAYHDYDQMLADPTIDLVVVCVRVPGHYDLVMRALRAGKATFCEWPLGANLGEAEEMANLASERGLRTLVGLQGRADPALTYARELIVQGDIGEVLTANLSVQGPANLERGAGRIWQADRTVGANTLTIAGGHAIDSFCYVVGEFTAVAARVATRIPQWLNTDTGQLVAVDAPDSISVAGRLASGAEAAMQVTAVPYGGSGFRIEIYGREGMLSISTPHTPNIGPNVLVGAHGKAAPEPLTVPDRFHLAPEGTPPGHPRNVAGAYARLADAITSGQPWSPDFAAAVQRHRLIDAIERSSAEGRAVALAG